MKIENQAGLRIEFLANGNIRHILAGSIRIGLNETTLFSKSAPTVYLRKRGETTGFIPLTGPDSPGMFSIRENTFVSKGSWEGLDYECVLRLSETSQSWQWNIHIRNTSAIPCEADLVYLQDVGLKASSSGFINEYYVSQYLEHLILQDKTYGAVVCCRQNMQESTGNPWIMLACKNGAFSACTDGMQFFGPSFRETGIPAGLQQNSMDGEYAGESSFCALQGKPFLLNPGESHAGVFVAAFMPDHPLATSNADLNRLPAILQEFDRPFTIPQPETLIPPAKSRLHPSVFLPADDLDDATIIRLFGAERRHQETEKDRILSFFCDQNNHVVLKSKELLTDRPHGHILQAKAGLNADESIVSTTVWAFGVFNSHLTQGNTNFNILLSVCANPFNTAPESGQRIFIEKQGHRFLLGVPSAFEMGLNHCRWIYKHGNDVYQVRTWTSKTSPQVNLDFMVINGESVNLIVTHQFDELNGWSVHPGNNGFILKPKAGSMITTHFPEAQFRMHVQGHTGNVESRMEEGLFLLETQDTNAFSMSFTGEVCAPAAAVETGDAETRFHAACKDAQSGWNELSQNLRLDSPQADVAAIREILPWYGMNAITHYLTPHGLEQFGGAAWGTRDVAQGPFDLLLCTEKYAEARQVLKTIFSNQNTDGGWPQWWMFDSYQEIRANSSHGDVYYWCIMALCNYIRVSGDLNFFDEVLPYYTDNKSVAVEHTSLLEHVDRLVSMITASFIPGTAFVPFGGGDWNDSLQPVSKELAERMISSWTVEMNYQAFMLLHTVYTQLGNTPKATEIGQICEQIRADFNTWLIRDGVVAGYGLVEEDRSISVLLHPSDTKTGIRYSILPMDRGIISGIFTPEQAAHHRNLINEHLKGPDGARLMDKPLQYRGGIQEIFQRAESSTFFGREIGLMYIHEHIRYAESQAITGHAGTFVEALRQANPVGYRDIVRCGDLRQSNCYYSSSDVAFKSRYDADARYAEINTGNIPLKGGWRVYSSGPGIYITLIIRNLLGLRTDAENIILDPVMPLSFDGLTANLQFLGYPLTFRYSVKQACHTPKTIRLNGIAMAFTPEANPYRSGGAVLDKKLFMSLLREEGNEVEVGL